MFRVSLQVYATTIYLSSMGDTATTRCLWVKHATKSPFMHVAFPECDFRCTNLIVQSEFEKMDIFASVVGMSPGAVVIPEIQAFVNSNVHIRESSECCHKVGANISSAEPCNIHSILDNLNICTTCNSQQRANKLHAKNVNHGSVRCFLQLECGSIGLSVGLQSCTPYVAVNWENCLSYHMKKVGCIRKFLICSKFRVIAEHFRVQMIIESMITLEVLQLGFKVFGARIGTRAVIHMHQQIEAESVIDLVIEAWISNIHFEPMITWPEACVMKSISIRSSLLQLIQRHVQLSKHVSRGVRMFI